MRSTPPLQGDYNDTTFSLDDGTMLGFFEAVKRHARDTVLGDRRRRRSTDVGARVLQVSQDDDWLTAASLRGFAELAQEHRLLIIAFQGPSSSSHIVRHGWPQKPL